MGQSLLQGYSWSKLYSFFWEEMTHVFDYNETNINTLLLFKLGTDFLTSFEVPSLFASGKQLLCCHFPKTK